MSIDKTEIEKIAKLAKLHLDDEDSQRYETDLSRILELVEQMNAVDTKGIEPLAHPMDISARLRADIVSEENQREQFQEIAPLVENGYYLVPKVIE